MAVANIETKTEARDTAEGMTWEYYMETPMSGRFEIIEGFFHQMPAPTFKHQIYNKCLLFAFTNYEIATGRGVALAAPSDILIRRFPRLNTRQPDVFFISHEQLERGGGIPERGPLMVAPELVVEIISDSETEKSINAKIRDYIKIGVRELWKVFPASQTVEVVALSQDGAVTVATYGAGQSAVSLTFEGLSVSVAAIFAE